MEKIAELPKRVAIYIRVSTEEQVERFGIDLQRAAIEALIASKKSTDQPYIYAGDDHVYIDDGISGTIPLEERPAFSRLIEDITLAPEGQKPFDAVAVYKIDRFARMLKILLSATDFFEQNDLQFMSVTESIDTSTAFGRAMLSIIGVIAELERETIKDRTGAGRVQAVKKGVHMGTGAPFGYAKDDSKRLVLLDEEVRTIQLIFDLYVQQKKSVYEIADYLSENRYLTPEASSVRFEKHKKKARSKSSYNWHPENIRRILSNELYTGRAYYGKTKNGKKVPKNEWLMVQVPLVINDVTFQRALEISESSKHGNKPARSNHVYLLTGLLRCDHCKGEHSLKHYVGTPQTVKSTGKKVYYYICKGKTHLYKGGKCNTLPIGADAIEDYIVNLCKKILSNPLHTYKYQQSLESTRLKTKHLRREEEQLLKLIEAAPEKRRRIAFQHSEGLFDDGQLKINLESVFESEKKNRAKLDEIRAQLAQCSLDEGYINTFGLFNEKYSQMLSDIGKNRAEAYQLIHTLIEQVIVYSRPVTEADRVAGKKSDGQMTASRIHVKFRLPQDMLNEIGRQGIEKAPIAGASSSQKDVLGAR
jgi:site-specific DNA recombinase